jgi:hypothetical protein
MSSRPVGSQTTQPPVALEMSKERLALAGIQVQVSSGSTTPASGSGSSSTSAQLANG